MAYYSRLNIRLGIIPVLPSEFNALQGTFQEIYNGLHLINAATDAAVGVLTPPEVDDEPTESFGFQLKMFFAPVRDDITAPGHIVHMPIGESIYRPGAEGYIAGSVKVSGPWAITLGTRQEDSGLILLGVPPAIVPLGAPGSVGDVVVTANDGIPVVGESGSEFWPIGRVIKEGYALLIPNMHM